MYCDLIRSEFVESMELMKVFSDNDTLIKSIQNAAKIFSDVFKNGGKVLSCGNGGSHCNAMHFSEELTGRYRETRRGYPAIVISDPAYLSCVSNDFGYEYVFSRYLESVATCNDALLSISTSGKSVNVLNAINSASLLGMKIVSLIGGKVERDVDIDRDNNLSFNKKMIDVEISVPHFQYADRIQEIHIKIIHILILLIEKEMSSVL